MTAAAGSFQPGTLRAFRRKADALFAGPRPAIRADGLSPFAEPPSAEGVLNGRLADILSRLGVDPVQWPFGLRKSVIMHDGRIVVMAGDSDPLGADDDIRIVTTTTTVLDSESLRVETSVLIFEREGER